MLDTYARGMVNKQNMSLIDCHGFFRKKAGLAASHNPKEPTMGRLSFYLPVLNNYPYTTQAENKHPFTRQSCKEYEK